jgi:choline dehydrogenase-like flavoprotein
MAHFPIVEPEDSTAATLKLLFQAFQRRKLPPGLLPRLAALPFGSAELLRMAYATKVKRRRALSQRAEFRLNIDVEQQPSPSSRITLSSVKDQLGMPRARLDWKITDREERSVRLFARKVQAELQAIGVAPIEIDPNVLNDAGDWLACSSDTYHMMGGTRMGTCAENSVVDSDLKVHGIQNAYIASCSVFPSGGSSNPTFTMMALTLRLAERLKMLAASAVV